MTRMTGPDCVVMCNLINTHTHTLKMFLFCFCLVSLCISIKYLVVSVQHNGGFLPDIILLTQCYYYHHRGYRLNAMKRFCIYSL